MALAFTQNDLTGDCSAVAGVDKEMAAGGVAGSAEDSISIPSSASSGFNLNWQAIPGASVTWDAGNWTVRFNVTTANMNLTWERIQISRYTSACVFQENIMSVTGLAIACSTTGVKSSTQTGTAGTAPAATDYLTVLVGFNNGAMSSQILGITEDQNIDSPFSVTVADSSKYWRRTGHVPGMRVDKGHTLGFGRSW